ncbi:MAG: 23S rRNA (guanosine(2251)-2'-O)-methyltransferase RlmB [Pyrinomonadaceae bacterium]
MSRSGKNRRFADQRTHNHESTSRGATQDAGPTEAILFGVNPVIEALKAGKRPIQEITIVEGARPDRLRELMDLARHAAIPIHRVPRIDLDRQINLAKHQGVVARIAAAKYADADALLLQLQQKLGTEDPPFVICLDGIEDPRNMGSIIRTAECAGLHGVFVPERRATGLTEVVAKVAAGALEYVPVARVTNLARLIEQLKERNIWVVGAAGDASLSYTDWDWSLPVALFVGSEGHGLHRLVRERCDALVRIPVSGHLQSLNVSVATGVIVFEILRQRSLRRIGGG